MKKLLSLFIYFFLHLFCYGQNSAVFISSYVEEFNILTQEGIPLKMFAVSGLASDPQAFKRTFNDNDALGVFTVRKEAYKRILKDISLQPDLDVTNLMEYCDNDGYNETLDFTMTVINTATKTSEVHNAFVAWGSQVVNLKYIEGTNSFRKSINTIKSSAREVRHGKFNNFNKALSAIDIVTNTINVASNAYIINESAMLLSAVQFDLALLRLETLSQYNLINDLAYTQALQEVKNELSNIPDGYWEKLAFSIRDHEQELVSGVVSIVSIANDVYALMTNNPVTGWIGAFIFAGKTYYEIKAWEDNLRDAAIAATLYGYLDKNSNSLIQRELVDIRDYTQYMFLKKLETVLTNGYLLFWEFFKPGQRSVRVFIEEENDNFTELLLNKRFQRFLDSFSQKNVQSNPAVSIGLILDSSGSMSSSDPTNIRQKAGMGIVDFLSETDNIFIVDFDDDSRLLNEGRTQARDKETLRSDLMRIDSDGGTNIGAGLQEMQKSLIQSNLTDPNSTAVLLLTDGQGDYNGEIQWFADNAIPVYTISYKDNADADLMDLLASESGGVYIKADSENDVISAFSDFYDNLTGYSKIYSFRITEKGVFETDQFYVESGLDEIRIKLSGEAYPDDFELAMPSNKVVHAKNIASTMVKGAGYIMLTIPSPLAGYWKAVIATKNPTACIDNSGDLFFASTKGPNSEGDLYSKGHSTSNVDFLFEVSAKSQVKIKPEIMKDESGTVTLQFIDLSGTAVFKDSKADVSVLAPDGSRYDMSNTYKNGKLVFVPAFGKGNYQFEICLKAKDRQNNPLERYYFRSVLVDKFVPGYIGVVSRQLGNYIYTEQGYSTRNRPGLSIEVYSKESGGTRLIGKGYVTTVSETNCTIELQEIFGTIRDGDIVRLNIRQWQAD